MRQLLKITATFTLALIFTAGIAFGQSNETDITQLTDKNDATVQQDGEENVADILQKGANKNTATIRQSSDPSADGVIESTIRQVGFNNFAMTNASRKNDRSSTTSQKQFGNRNRAFINQDEGTSPDGNEGITLTQYQDGNRNLARMSGGDSYNAEQRQIGHRNVATTSGNGKNADVFQRQVGDDNVARQEGNMSFAGSDQIQLGDDNRSLLYGIGHEPNSNESYLTRQDGSDNLARLDANGNGGVLEVRQTGPENVAQVDWSTGYNDTFVKQNGFDNTAVVNSN